MPRSGAGRVASVTGRYYAMDRDRRWERIQAAYDLLVHGRGEHQVADAPAAPRKPPTGAARPTSSSSPRLVGAEGRIRAGDSVLCFNFRPDRMREIVRALAEPGFGRAPRICPAGAGAAARQRCDGSRRMTEYQQGWPYPVAFRSARPPTRSAR